MGILCQNTAYNVKMWMKVVESGIKLHMFA